MISLAVDTAFEHLAMALCADEVPLADFMTKKRRRNSTIIFETLDKLLSKASLSLSEVDVFVVNQGPGSYTGVRIGMSMVKSLAQVCSKTVVAVNSLQLLASQISRDTEPFPVLLNCTGQELFHAEFQIHGGHIKQLTPIRLSLLQELHRQYNESRVILHRISNSSAKQDSLFDSFLLLAKDNQVADGILLNRVGRQILASAEFDPMKPVHPLYIKRDI